MTDALGSFYAGKRVLLTGDTGFKGGWLALWLTQLRADVTGYALPPETEPNLFSLANVGDRVRHVDGDIRDLERLRACCLEHQPEIVFHLAAQPLVRRSYQRPKETFDVNVGGSVNVLEALRETSSARVCLMVTSDKCYENREWVWGYRENDPLGGHDPYSASKAAAEIVVAAYRSAFFFNGVEGGAIGLASARSGNVIGGGDWAEDRIVPDAIRAFGRGVPLEVRNPHSVRPWQHVLEPLSGYLALALRLWNEPGKYTGAWNFGPSGDSTATVAHVADKLADSFGQQATWRDVSNRSGQPHEAEKLMLSCEKARLQLGWKAVFDVADAIDLTASWYRQVINGGDAERCCGHDIDAFMSRARKQGQWWAA